MAPNPFLKLQAYWSPGLAGITFGARMAAMPSLNIKVKYLTIRSFGDGLEPRYIFGAEPLDQ